MAEENHEQNLEQKLNDKQSKGFMRKAIDLGFNTAVAVGATAFAATTLGASSLLTGTAFAGGSMVGNLIKKKKNKMSFYDIINAGLKTYSSVNTALYPMVQLGNITWPVVGNLGNQIAGKVGGYVAKTLYSITAYNWAFTSVFKGVHHLYENKFNPKGIGKSISHNFWHDANRFSWIFLPGYALASNGIGELALGKYQVPTFAANAFPAALYGGINPPGSKKKEKKNEHANKNYASQAASQAMPQYSMPGMQPAMAGA